MKYTVVCQMDGHSCLKKQIVPFGFSRAAATDRGFLDLYCRWKLKNLFERSGGHVQKIRGLPATAY
jgi:hypothetical protein